MRLDAELQGEMTSAFQRQEIEQYPQGIATVESY